MKLQQIFEIEMDWGPNGIDDEGNELLPPKQKHFYDENPEIWNYLLFNTLIGSYNRDHWILKEFKNFLNSPESKSVKHQAIEFLERNPRIYGDFMHEHRDDVNEVKISGNTVSFETTSFTVYCYDYLGEPPFNFSGEELNSFGIFDNCKTLTELPTWMPKNMWCFQLGHSGVTSLKGIEKIIKHCGEMVFTDNPIKSHVLGIANIEGINQVDFDDNPKLTEIMNNHIHDDNPMGTEGFEIDIFALQADLIDADLAEYAKL